MSRTEWDRARVEQYADRTEQTLIAARYQLHRVYTEGSTLNVAAVDALIDPVVDEEYQSPARPVSLNNLT